MQFGITLAWSETGVEDFRSNLRLAEASGWSRIGIADSPTVFREQYVSLSVAACETRLPLSTMVQTPLGRHPVTVASAVSALQELTGGRFVLVLGAGGSSPAAMGARPARLAELSDYVGALRRLLAGQATTWAGATLTPPRNPRPTPIHIATYGPKARRMAGAIADGVVIGSGPRNPLLPQWIEEVRAGAADAGRAPGAMEIWIMSRLAVAETREDALTEIQGSLASAARFAFKSPAELASAPEHLQAAVRRLQESYAVKDHTTWDGQNARLLRDLGLMEFLAERFAVVGSLAECREQLAGLAGIPGLTGVQLSSLVRNPAAVIGALPALRPDQALSGDSVATAFSMSTKA